MIYSIVISFILIFSAPTNIAFSAHAKQRGKTSNKQAIKINKKDLPLHVLGAAKNRWTLQKTLNKRLSKKDTQFLRSKTRQLKIKLKKNLNIKYLQAKRAFNIKGYRSLFYVSKNGKQLKYQNNIFSIKKGKSLESKFNYIQKVLSKTKKKSFSRIDLFIPKAHAYDPYEGTSNSASLDILMLLSYLEVYGNGDDPFSVLTYIAETEPNLLAAMQRLYGTNGNKALSGITCDNEYRMTIHFADGTSAVLNWNGQRGNAAKSELTENVNGNWNPISFFYDDEMTHTLNGQFYFCQMMGGSNTANGVAVMNAINEMVAPIGMDGGSYGEDYSGEALE